MKRITVLVLAAVMALALAAPAFATGADGAGRDFGQHHADMAQMGGFDGTMNSGMHSGFSDWVEPQPE